MNKFGIPQNTYNKIKKFFSSVDEIEKIKIFGSRAKGNYKPFSDIDLVIYGEKITEKMVLHILTELDELPTPYKFDVIDYKTINNENLKKSIDEYGIDF